MAASRSLIRLDFASTSSSDACGASACANWTSRLLSRAHPASTVGYFVEPVWLTFLNDGGAGRPNVELKKARSLAAFGLSKALTIAIVCRAPVPLRPSQPRVID